MIWKGTDNLLRGIVTVTLRDSNGDEWQEILVECHDHGESKKIMISYQEKK